MCFRIETYWTVVQSDWLNLIKIDYFPFVLDLLFLLKAIMIIIHQQFLQLSLFNSFIYQTVCCPRVSILIAKSKITNKKTSLFVLFRSPGMRNENIFHLHGFFESYIFLKPITPSVLLLRIWTILFWNSTIADRSNWEIRFRIRWISFLNDFLSEIMNQNPFLKLSNSLIVVS